MSLEKKEETICNYLPNAMSNFSNALYKMVCSHLHVTLCAFTFTLMSQWNDFWKFQDLS